MPAVKETGLWHSTAGIESWLYFLLAARPWVSYITFLSLRLSVCQRERNNTTSLGFVVMRKHSAPCAVTVPGSWKPCNLQVQSMGSGASMSPTNFLEMQEFPAQAQTNSIFSKIHR